MTSLIEIEHRIGLDAFYEGKQVRDKKSPLYISFFKHVLEEVKKKFVVAAHKVGITFQEKIESYDGREGYRVRQEFDPIQIATVFCQISKTAIQTNLLMHQNKLYDVLYQEFGKNWDESLELKIMHD